MKFFDHKDLGNHFLQLCPNVVKYPVYSRLSEIGESIGFHFSYGHVLGTEIQGTICKFESLKSYLNINCCLHKYKFLSIKYFCSKYEGLVSCHCIKVELGEFSRYND
jgi:hypothetical protein